MVIVLSDEEEEINHSHWFSKARMKSRSGQLSVSHCFNPRDYRPPKPHEVRSEILEKPGIVLSIPGGAILQIRRPKSFSTVIEIIDTPGPKGFEVNEVTYVFLNRPPALDSSCEQVGGKDRGTLFEAKRCAPDSLQDLWECLDWDPEFEDPLKPDSTFHLGQGFRRSRRHYTVMTTFPWA